jgi:hypothetical protein
MKQLYKLVNLDVRRRCWEAVKSAPEGYVVTIAEPTRTLDQNALLWPLLECLSKQVLWYGKTLTPENWKDLMSASLRKLDVVPNIDGSGFVALGQSTSKMSKAQFSELIELIYAFGAERGVKFTEQECFQ